MAKKSAKPAPSKPAAAPDWPASLVNYKFNPHQQIDTVIPGQIYTLPKFFPARLCDDLTRWFETSSNLGRPTKPAGKPQDLVFSTTKMPPRKDYAARVNDRAVVVDKALARSLWAQLRPVLVHDTRAIAAAAGYDVAGDDEDEEEELDEEMGYIRDQFETCIGLNDNLRIYRYLPGHYFGQHYDESVKASVLPTNTSDDAQPLSGTTLWTLLIYLTGEAEGEVSGGGTIFYPNEHEAATYNSLPQAKQEQTSAVHVRLKKGMLLLHKHGDDCYLHEGELVKAGVKWIFRSDLVF